jgi:hypothetical protein
MPATAKNYDVTHIHQGPGDLWIIGGGVPDSATPQLTLTDGTPDSVAHPNSIHLGGTDSAIGFAAAPKLEDIKIDQADTAVARYLTEMELSFEADLKQLDPTIIQNVAPYAVFSNSSGYNQLTFGGGSLLLNPVCVACIAPKRGVANQYIVFTLFNAHGTLGLSSSVGRSKAAIYKAQFKGLADITRTPGRQTGVFYETL